MANRFARMVIAAVAAAVGLLAGFGALASGHASVADGSLDDAPINVVSDYNP